MRIGTWNLEGQWSPDHLALLTRENCDVWLLTEVRTEVVIPGMQGHRTADLMGPSKSWAGIFSALDATIEPDPHPATAMADIDGFRFMRVTAPSTTSRCRSTGMSMPLIASPRKPVATDCPITTRT